MTKSSFVGSQSALYPTFDMLNLRCFIAQASKSELIKHIDHLMGKLKECDNDKLEIHHLEKSAVDMAVRLRVLTEVLCCTAHGITDHRLL